jgi:hypothetical protein
MHIARVVFIVAALISLGVGCADVLPQAATPTPTATATPIPTATPTRTPRPTRTPTLTPEPTPEVALGSVSDFEVRLQGLEVQGSFKLGDEPVSIRYRPAHLQAAEDGLQVIGDLTYTFQDRTHTQRDVGGLLTPVGETCDEMLFTTDPIRLPELRLVVPTQELPLDLNAVGGTTANLPARVICQATRMAMEQPDSLTTQFLIQQANALLQP